MEFEFNVKLLLCPIFIFYNTIKYCIDFKNLQTINIILLIINYSNITMNPFLLSFGNFIISPFIRWFFVFLRLILTVVLYLNQIERFSEIKAFTGLNFKWHSYILAIIYIVSIFITFIGLWITIPFSNKLPEYWYIPIFIVSIIHWF